MNSVEWNTPLLLSINNQLVEVKIGEYIDNYIDNIDTADLESHPNDTKLGWIRGEDVKILSCDKTGKISWEKVEAVTRHPPMNKDGTDTLLEVITRSGRKVVATKAKSFLKRVDNEIVQVDGCDIRIGDFLPVSTVLPVDGKGIDTLKVSTYLPKTEYIYMSEVEKAIECSKTSRNWWKKNKGIEFQVPHSRSDAFRETFISEKQKQQFVPGCVYPKKTTATVSTIPENIVLDTEFGFLVGAYLAEGCVTRTQLLISNIDEDFLDIVRKNCAKFNVNYHMDVRCMKGWVSKTLRIHSTVLTMLFKHAFGKGAAGKKIPAWVLGAPDSFLQGLMNGYFSGDGTLGNIGTEVKNRNTISATSISRGMLESLQQILLRYDIRSSISFHDTKKYEAKYGKFTKVNDAYKLNISCGNTKRFSNMFSLVLKAKQIKLDKMDEYQYYHEHGRFDIVPDIKLSIGTINIHRDKIPELLQKTKDENDRAILENILTENIMYDEVIAINEVSSEHTHVYDLTVENTRNFNIYNGLAMADTFHLSGVASASKSVRGVPRIEELTRVTKNVKAPSMTIYIKDAYNKNQDKCRDIKNRLEITTFKDIVSSSRIYYEPSDLNTTIENDKKLVDLYNEFNYQINNNDMSPWLLRFELNRQKMLEHGLTMIDLKTRLDEHFGDRVSCMFSDDNTNDLIFRIKLTDDKSTDTLTDLKALESTIIESMTLKGIEKVNKIEMLPKDNFRYDDVSKVFHKTSEWVMYTDGTNLAEVLANPFVDASRTVSNDVNEVYTLLGVEAARQCLFNELNSVMKDAEASVNFRHLSILVDTMTNKGAMMSIDRHGINKGDIGPLAKCSFEEVNDVLVKAGVFSEVDRVNGVSANIILGQIAPCGTGDTDILLDERKLLPPSEENKRAVEFDKRMTPVTGDDANEVCTIENLGFDFEMPTPTEIVSKKQMTEVKFV